MLTFYLIFLWNCTITYSDKKYVCNIKYNGLLWVGLDYWTIWKYHSDDRPMKWVDWKISTIQ